MKFTDIQTILHKKIPSKAMRNVTTIYLCAENEIVYTDGFFLIQYSCTDIPRDKKGKTFDRLGNESAVKFPSYQSLIPVAGGKEFEGDAEILLNLSAKKPACVSVAGKLGRNGISIITLTNAKTFLPKQEASPKILFFGEDIVTISYPGVQVLLTQVKE